MSRPTEPLATACRALGAAVLVLAPARGFAEPPTADLAKEYRDAVAPLVERHCLGCHRGPKPKGDLDLARVHNSADDLPRWELVLERLRAGEMPPKDAKSRPTPAERKAVISWI